MEPKHVCGYEGAKGKLFDDVNEAKKSLRVEFIENELKRCREQISSYCSKAYSATINDNALVYRGGYRRDYSYPPPEVVIRDLIFNHPFVILDTAQKCYDLSVYIKKLEVELEQLTDKKPLVDGWFNQLKSYFTRK